MNVCVCYTRKMVTSEPTRTNCSKLLLVLLVRGHVSRQVVSLPEGLLADVALEGVIAPLFASTTSICPITPAPASSSSGHSLVVRAHVVH